MLKFKPFFCGTRPCLISAAVLAHKVAFRPEAIHVKNILKLKYITLQQDDGGCGDFFVKILFVCIENAKC